MGSKENVIFTLFSGNGKMKISVIIPCYNADKTIDDTLKSIFNQTCGNFEIIVVDDGSNDDTAKILKKYSHKIKYIYQENGGVSKARNTGVSHAQGEWIAFCDSDDLWHPEKIEVIDHVVKKIQGINIIFSDFFILINDRVVVERGMGSPHSVFPIFKNGNVQTKHIFKNCERNEIDNSTFVWKKFDTYFGNIFRWLIMGNFILPSAIVIRKETFLKEGGFKNEFRNAEDTELFLRLAKKHNFLYVDLPLVGYRRIEGSLLSTSMEKTIINGIRSLEQHGKNDLEVYRKYKKLVDKTLAQKYARLSYFYLSELRRKECIRSGRVSLKYNKVEILAWLTIAGSMVPRRILMKFRELKKRFR